MKNDPVANRDALLDQLVKQQAIDVKNARSIAVPQSNADIIELLSAKIGNEDIALGFSQVCSMPIFDEGRFSGNDFSDNEFAVSGGEGHNYWLLIDREIYVTNPFNQELTEKAFSYSANKADIIEIGILPLGYLNTDKWKAIENVSAPGLDGNEIPANKDLAESKLDEIINKALEIGASDIHFVPNHRNEVDVRMRIDGSVLPMDSYKLSLHKSLCISLLDTKCLVAYVKSEAQDGQFGIKHKDEQVNFRVATIPKKTRGQKHTKITIRVLDGDDNLVNLEQLGLSSHNLALLKEAFKEPQGALLVTGPTGSGKSTTLYGGLRYVSSSNPESTYYTVEDPIEQEVDNFIQIECNKYLTFATALRNLLRQDPDVVMLGEIRDPETANIAIEIANTGHLLCSTLHTKNAHETIGRIRDFDILPSVLAESLLLIVSQRLAKRLCNYCKVSVPQSKLESHYSKYKEELSGFYDSEESIEIYEPNHSGCEHCFSGYKGRVGLTEVLVMDENLEDMIIEGISPKEMRRRQISQGLFKDMWHDGLRRVVQGETSINACERILGRYQRKHVKSDSAKNIKKLTSLSLQLTQ